MKHILVTGSDGFIGSHLTEILVREGYQVRAFVHYNSFNSWGWLDHCASDVKGKFEVFAGDIRDPHGVKIAMKKCDAVFHLAALIGIPYSYHSPDTYVETNIKGTLNVLQAVRELEVGKMIHTSTSEVYGTARFVPITENHPLQGQSPYSASKIAADAMALSFFNAFELPVTTARPFNTFGPRQSARAIIPTIISQIASGIKEIRLGDLSPTRDLNFVRDTCEGLLAIAESDATIGREINISSGREISMRDVFDLIRTIMKADVCAVSDEERIRPKHSEVFRLLGDNSLLEELTGFSPSFSLEEGLQITCDWFSRPENLNKYKAVIYNL